MVGHIRRAVRFIKHKASDYGVNSDRMGLWRGSASGHLSLLVGMSPEVAIDGALQEWELNQAIVAAIIPFAAPTILARVVVGNPKEREKRVVLRLWNDQYQEFSPVSYVTNGDPPTVMV
jgi:acetyl esterase/lipase